MVPESLLSIFPPVSTDEWERTIRETMPGADYPVKLIWRPEEGLAIKPYYRADDLTNLHFLNANPGEFPYVRGTRCQGGWRIREEIDASDPENANHHAIEAVVAGAEEISFHARLENESDIAIIFADLNEIPIHVEGVNQGTIRLLLKRLKVGPRRATVSADLDPLADIEFSAEVVRSAPTEFRPFLFDCRRFHESGAGAIEEIGFTLSAAVDFLTEMQDSEIDIDRVADTIAFRFAIGPEFYIQVAKLRAFRMVWAQVMEGFGGTRENAKAIIHASPSCWDKTIYDRHVNVLRSTTETMAAVLGSADSISVAPFDECCKAPDESSRRLARNTQILLKGEAWLDRVADPAGGSYLIEALTDSIAMKAWKLFQELESAGGYRKAKDEGIIASVLSRRTTARQDAVTARKLVLTGTNRFVNIAEEVTGSVDASLRTSDKRVATQFEELRMCTEHYASVRGRLPLIILAEIGDARMRSARSQFASDFLACAGLPTEVRQFESAAGVAASGGDLIVLCSSDTEYLPITEELLPALAHENSRAKVLIAGNPSTALQLTDLGVVGFIHLRTNAIEVLIALQHQLGIKE